MIVTHTMTNLRSSDSCRRSLLTSPVFSWVSYLPLTVVLVVECRALALLPCFALEPMMAVQ